MFKHYFRGIFFFAITACCFSHILFSQQSKQTKGLKNYTQPDWFNSQRVQIHSRVTGLYKDPDNPLFSHWAEKVVKKVGANILVRHIKTDESPIHWKSEWGWWTPLANKRNIIQEAINEAHQHQCRMIGYYNHYTDSYLRDSFPQSKCKNVDGQDVIQQGRGTLICFNSPQFDSITIRLVEFAKMGGDGIYFDEVHMPRSGCWCVNCKAKFKKRTGRNAPEKIDINDTLYQDYQDFNNQSVVEGFKKWQKALMAVNPNLVMLIGSNTLPKLIDRHLNTDLFRIAHSHKTEPEIPMRTLGQIPKGILSPDPLIWRGLSYTFSRDIADGRPAHYWVFGVSYLPVSQILAITKGIISFGNIANLDMAESLAPDMDFVPSVEYGNKVSAAFTHTTPIYSCLIHFNEQALKKYPGTQALGWQNFLSSFYGSFATIQKMKWPVGIISDSQLAEGLFHEATVLIIPNAEILSKQQREQIVLFEKKGGKVIWQRKDWNWYDNEAQFDAASSSLKKELGKRPMPIIQSSEGNENYYANYFKKEEAGNDIFLAAYSNNLEWIPLGAKAKQMADSGQVATAPPPIRDVQLVIRKNEKPLQVLNVEDGTAIPYSLSGKGLVINVPKFQDGIVVEVIYKKKK